MRVRGPNGRAAPLVALALGVAGLTLHGGGAKAADFAVIHQFVAGSAKGYAPSGELSFGPGGALYGVTRRGGKTCPDGEYSCGGTVYQLSAPKKGSKWTYQVLHSFGAAKSGASPAAGVTIAKDGALIGSTTYGGETSCAQEPHHWGCGTFWRLGPPDGKSGSWSFDVLARLPGGTSPRLPEDEFVQLKDGSIAGSTGQGGQFGKGAAFLVLLPTPKPDAKVTPQGTPLGYRIVWDPAGSRDAEEPGAFFRIFDHNVSDSIMETIYGVMKGGGDGPCADSPTGCGGVLSLTPKKKSAEWPHDLIYRFLGGRQGSFPISGGIRDPNGAIYGAAYGGVPCDSFLSLGCGVIYRMTPPPKTGGAWGYEVIYSFKGGKDGDRPAGRMALDKQGRLYGVTSYGGKCAVAPKGGCGTIWRLTPPKKPGGGWKHDVLHAFDGGAEGKWPSSGLASNGGALFGSTDSVAYRMNF